MNSKENIQLTKINSKIDKFDDDLTELKGDFKELKMGVIGSKKIGVNGLVQKVDKNTRYIDKHKKWKYIIYGGASVIWFLITLLIILIKMKILTGG